LVPAHFGKTAKQIDASVTKGTIPIGRPTTK
jgi:hypothetical protein